MLLLSKSVEGVVERGRYSMDDGARIVLLCSQRQPATDRREWGTLEGASLASEHVLPMQRSRAERGLRVEDH